MSSGRSAGENNDWKSAVKGRNHSRSGYCRDQCSATSTFYCSILTSKTVSLTYWAIFYRVFVRFVSKKIAIVFAQFGPYHHARVRALQRLSEAPVVPVQIAAGTSTYAWAEMGEGECLGLQTLCSGRYEEASALDVFRQARRLFKRNQITHALLPSYAPAPETALLLAAKSCGVRCIMMNESHAGTERAVGWRRTVKRLLISQFDAALVGGSPQKRHFTSLGIAENRIFTGYDAIDNDYFATAAEAARENAEQLRSEYGLPHRYFLNLGRMVEKKNLQCLIEAYARFTENTRSQAEPNPIPDLVFVGSGSEEASLRKLCQKHNLEVVDHPVVESPTTSILTSRETENPTTDHRPPTSDQPSNRPIPLRSSVAVLLCRDKSSFAGHADSPTHRLTDSPTHCAGVHFYGFRQINENPIFYGLAEAFILPSLWEEWGLVVNEAMASGLPIVVSETAGCAEDLVADGENGFTFDPTNPYPLAGFLDRLAADASLRKRMSRISQERIAHWDCDHFARNAIAAVEAAHGE